LEGPPITESRHSGLAGGSNCVVHHPCVGGALAAGGKSDFALMDLSKGIVRSFAFDDCVSISWNYNGSHAVLAGRNAETTLCDPRDVKTNSVLSTKSSIVRAFSALFLGNTHHFSVFGQDKTRKPKALIYDARKTASPLINHQLELGAAIILSHYDTDCQLMFLTTRGSTNLEVYEMESCLSSSKLTRLSSFVSSSPYQGFCAVPKTSLDVNDCEVGRIIQLGSKDVTPISLRVQRKLIGFHADLFPDTRSDESCMSLEDFFGGANPKPQLKDLSPTAAWRNPTRATAKQAAEEKKEVPISKKEADMKLLSFTSEKRRILDEAFRKSAFANMKAKEPGSLEFVWTKLQRGKDVTFGLNMKSNAKHIAVTWKSTGGSVMTVLDANKPSRAPTKVPVIKAHSGDITAFDLSLLQENLLATGSVDGKAKVWAIPYAGLATDINDPIIEVSGIGKIHYLKFHPSVENVMATSSSSFDSSIVQIWDLENRVSKYDVTDCEKPIPHFDFSVNGNLFGLTCKDGFARIYDIRSSTTASHTVKLPQVVRDVGISFLGEHPCFMTYGWGKGSIQQFSFWDIRNLRSASDSPALTLPLEQNNSQLIPHYDEDCGILYVASEGERVIRFIAVDITEGTVKAEPLGSYTSPALIKALSYLPKTSLNVKEVEIAKALKLGDEEIRPITFSVPRKRKEFFQDDIYVAARSGKALFTATEWFEGGKKEITRVSLQPDGMAKLSEAPAEELTDMQKRRASMLRDQKEKASKDRPTMIDHFKKFEVSTDAPPVSSRWDAVSKAKGDVADDEW
jgi:coronin-7